MSDRLSIFVPINKIDEEQRLVYGQVAAEVLDNSGEMFDYEGSKPFFQKWSENAFETSGGKSHGNVRVMHTSKVAGIVASPLGFNDEDRVIEACAKVIDDNEWEMVKAGGYTGFSMGGRYVSRATKSDGVKSYVADPIEISLVDKPCIPTATFAVVKADGLVEDRRFRDDLYQKADIGGNMYEPTNDEMLPVAQSLAKAAGKTEADWLEFMDAARADLIAKHDGGQQQTEIPADNAEAPAQADEPVAKADHVVEGCEVEDCADCAAAKVDAAEEEAPDAAAAEEGEAEEEKAAAKADAAEAPELQQGWLAKDKSFHLTKAAARAHNKSLDAPAEEPSLADRLAASVGKADAILNGEVEEVEEEVVDEEAAEKAEFILVVDGALAKFDGFAGNDLVKGMYEVSRLADLICSLRYVHSSLACDAAYEGDGSTIPAEMFEHLKGLGATLIRLTEEEVKELLARAAKDANDVAVMYADDAPIIELAASTLGLEKAALGEELRKVDVKPVETGETDALAKVDALEKRAVAAEEQLTKLAPLVASLEERLEKMAKTPRDKAPTTRVVEKGDDGTAPAGGLDLAKMAKEHPDLMVDAAIRAAQSHGRQISLPASPGQ